MPRGLVVGHDPKVISPIAARLLSITIDAVPAESPIINNIISMALLLSTAVKLTSL